MKYLSAILFALGITFTGALHAGGGSVSVPLAITPDPQVDFGEQPVGSEGASQTVSISFAAAGSTSPWVVEIISIASSTSDFRIFQNNCTQLGGISGPTSCTFDATFAPSQLGELLADLQIECQVVPEVGVTTIVCTDTSATQTVEQYFRGIGIAASAITVPTLGQWGITLAALTLIGLGVFRLRRRGHAQ